ncbi:hypothetical protein QZH41_002051 [Actinostola sp. cb2023]|nr:hypothetical protein QZH41_002051 [Actinostola sp. cb2023]
METRSVRQELESENEDEVCSEVTEVENEEEICSDVTEDEEEICSDVTEDEEESCSDVTEDEEEIPASGKATELYKNARISLNASILMLISYVQKHHITGEAFKDLLQIIEAHCPTPNHCPRSVSKLYDFFENMKGTLKSHMFCSFCKLYRGIGPLEAVDCSCPTCGRNETSFFIGIQIDEQIRLLFREKGEVVKTSLRGHVMTFPFRQTLTGHAQLRNAQEVLQNCFQALEDNASVNGFKAPSPLTQLPSFSIPESVAIDYMHSVCLGVVKTLVGLWFASTCSDKPWYCGNRIEEVDGRLLQIKPPNFINRVPRSLESHRKHWKGPRYLLMNQHLLLHLVENVTAHGPLWASSLFVFEDWNGDITDYYHGTQNVPKQAQ